MAFAQPHGQLHSHDWLAFFLAKFDLGPPRFELWQGEAFLGSAPTRQALLEHHHNHHQRGKAKKKSKKSKAVLGRGLDVCVVPGPRRAPSFEAFEAHAAAPGARAGRQR